MFTHKVNNVNNIYARNNSNCAVLVSLQNCYDIILLHQY